MRPTHARPNLLFCGALKRHGGFAMGSRILKFALAVIATLLSVSPVLAQQSPCDGKQTNSSKIAADGTAYVTRIVPVPATISPEAQKVLARAESDVKVPYSLEQAPNRHRQMSSRRR